MKALDILKKLEKETMILEKHPCRNLDLDIRIHYLNGLALLAKEDEKICEKEKEYLSILINTFELTDENLDEVINFAEHPDESAILEMIEAFKDNDLKYSFAFGCIILANIDGNFDENEEPLIQQYSQMLNIKDYELNELKEIFTLIKSKKEAELYNFLKNSNIKKKDIEYIFDYYKISDKKTLTEKEKEILTLNLFKPTFNHGGLQNATEIMSKPISKEQYCIFLNHMYEEEKIKLDEKRNIVTIDEKLVLSREKGLSKIIFFNNSFILDDIIIDERVTFVTPIGIELFIEWMNELFDTNYRLAEYFSNGHLGVMTEEELNCKYEFSFYQNRYYVNESNSYWDLDELFSNDKYKVDSHISIARNEVEENYCSLESSFRLMR